MNTVDPRALADAIGCARDLLHGGLIAMDIWHAPTGLSLAGHNTQPAATALFGTITTTFQRRLVSDGFPDLAGHWIVNLDGGRTGVVLLHGREYLTGLLVQDVVMGHLLNVVVPRLREILDPALEAEGCSA